MISFVSSMKKFSDIHGANFALYMHLRLKSHDDVGALCWLHEYSRVVIPSNIKSIRVIVKANSVNKDTDSAMALIVHCATNV